MPSTTQQQNETPPNANPEQPLRVLSTLREDGTRRWLRPRPASGRFHTWRKVVGYLLIVIFAALPYVSINGKPAILLDILAREFTFFGVTLLPTDTLLLALFVVGLFLTIFFVTSLFGRVWCGWMCPQTVYLELVYRPIERLFEGAPGRRMNKPLAPWKKPARFVVYLLVSMFLAHVFLAYFVGVDQLALWVQRSPFDHPTSFIVMVVVTGLMMFDFGFFREQTCIVACPYGRFQSVMLDRSSLIITYDEKRGEPRGRKKSSRRRESNDVSLDVVESGDCVDCGWCVVTCPTGIDIRDGLQMECIGCAQCIDACDSVMEKLKRPLGLVRYTTQEAMEGSRTHYLRPRPIIYATIIGVLIGAFVYVLLNRQDADVTLLRGVGLPSIVMADGRISNEVRVKIVNRSTTSKRYTITPAPGEAFTIRSDDGSEYIDVEPMESVTKSMRLMAERSFFTGIGRRRVLLRIEDGAEFSDDVEFTLIGPAGPPPGSSAAEQTQEGES
ncbi:MAG: cytochrome c oxidase accessory protein CcoG [Planctomycetota bacterium]|jgi:cytochrome c oxidase accessory protein FixG